MDHQDVLLRDAVIHQSRDLVDHSCDLILRARERDDFGYGAARHIEQVELHNVVVFLGHAAAVEQSSEVENLPRGAVAPGQVMRPAADFEPEGGPRLLAGQKL